MTDADREAVGHYVLGLMEPAETSVFETRLAREANLAAAVAKLRQHLEKLDDTAGHLPADPALWAKIERQLGAPPAESQPVGSMPRPANDNGWTRWTGLAASVLVALGLGYLVGTQAPGTQDPIMIAVLLNEADSQPGVIVEAFADDSVRLVPLDRFALPDDRVFEVWTLPDPETGPVSLGTFNDPQTIRLSGPDLSDPQPGQLYEITLEPLGGSPTGRPTGPILVKGFARAPL